MSNVTFTLSDDPMRQLTLRLCVEEWLDNSPHEYMQASRDVLKKNEELYRRLA